ncbi:hypothetical protein NDU88_009050 [Pleurodeles waltl]|uniref:Uncharacterized protein n=1 Tax=Pleurodeles waltl TaxID=8319 RepID=A0AAV7P126_PLEWA|nr:hypothetical protein NDU88_009050 [Pleurodeles waltl]
MEHPSAIIEEQLQLLGTWQGGASNASKGASLHIDGRRGVVDECRGWMCSILTTRTFQGLNVDRRVRLERKHGVL